MTSRALSQRVVSPEILDTLSPDDPAAIRGRRDLDLVNFAMGNRGWLYRALRKHSRPDSRLLELGAGDGLLGAELARRGICRAECLHGLDLVQRPPAWPQGAAWTAGNILELPSFPEAETMVANLFLHHFTDPQLRELGTRVPGSCRVILAVEPARRSRHLWLGRFFNTVARMHAVTRHDMMTSIRGGFYKAELGNLLGLGTDWDCQWRMTWRGAYYFTAVRRMP